MLTKDEIKGGRKLFEAEDTENLDDVNALLEGPSKDHLIGQLELNSNDLEI